MSNCQTELPALPAPWDFTYEWVTTPFGVRRSFSANHYNGSPCTNQVPIFTVGQMRAYATAAVLTERERQQSLHMRRLTGLWRFGREVLPVANISFEAFLFQLDGFINEKTQAHPLTPPAKEPT